MVGVFKLNSTCDVVSTAEAPPTSPTSLLDAGPFDCVKKLTHDQVKGGWREAFSASECRTYYYNVFTRESVWSIPTTKAIQREQRRMVDPSRVGILETAVNELIGNSAPPQEDNQAASSSGVASASPNVKRKDTVKRMYSPDPDEVENDRKAKKFKIGGERFVCVKRFKGRPYVNIREYYWNLHKTRLLAGKKGLNLTAEEWMMLTGQSSEITKCLATV